MPQRGFESFKIELQNTLNNLYNPVYRPDDIIFDVLRLDPIQGLDAVRPVLTQTIGELKAPESTPPGSKIDLLYHVLDHRFVQSQSQESASELLNMSTRHFRRKQHEAIHALALRIWDFNQRSATTSTADEPADGLEVSRIEAIAHEIQVLTRNSAGITANLETVLHKAVEIAGFMQDSQNLKVVIRPVQEGSVIPLHPSVLRQVVLYVLLRAMQAGGEGEMVIEVHDEGLLVGLDFSCSSFSAEFFQIPELEALLPALGGKAAMDNAVSGWNYKLLFPRTRWLKVLVIDDNLDQVYLYRRLLSASAYDLIHLPGGEDLLDFIAVNKPDVLLMDILLPGIDGWDLLMQIRKNPATSAIPVVICSVMGNESMARSLGANGYLLKPVDRKRLLEILEQVIPPGAEFQTNSQA
jgi:CheY-like chemotaxis protein